MIKVTKVYAGMLVPQKLEIVSPNPLVTHRKKKNC